MIISKAPFRISFAGGGSDLESFYGHNGHGAVISTTIDKYMYIMLHPYFHDKIRIKYSKLEDVDRIQDIIHPLVREALRLVRINKGVEIASIADVPAGTGIGSSSSFTVSLLHALHAYQNEYVTKEELAQESCKIEIDILKEPIGKQDQYASSFGGLNYIQFNSDGTVFVEPLLCDRLIKQKLLKNLIMFYVGNERKAGNILCEQKKNMKKAEKYQMVQKMVHLAKELKESLNKGKVDQLGEILHQGWLLKKELADGICNSNLDKYYKKALKAGAIGGKLLGAGGGGFILFFCKPKYHDGLRKALRLRELQFGFDHEGAKLIYFDKT